VSSFAALRMTTEGSYARVTPMIILLTRNYLSRLAEPSVVCKRGD
jgi:hypothetical protein